MTLLSEKVIIAKSKEVKTRSNLAKSSNEGCGSKHTFLPLLLPLLTMIHVSLGSRDSAVSIATGY
jgi:hypothetical protein